MAGGAAAVLWALLLGQGTAELEAGASIDVRAGRSPITVPTTTGENQSAEQSKNQLAERSQVRVSATPLLGVRWTGERSELRALSATRVLWRPVPYPDQRPLFLEALEVGHSTRPTPRSRWRLDLRSTYGEEDYTSLLRQFGANQPALPTALSLFTVNAFGDGSWRASRRATLLLLASGIYRHPLGDLPSTSSSAPALPTQTLVDVTPALRYGLDRRTSLEVRAGIGDTDIEGSRRGTTISGRVNVLTLQPQVGFIRDLSRTQQLRLFAGLTRALVLAGGDAGGDWRTLTPLFRGDLSSLLWRTPSASVRSLVGMEGAWYADPVLGLAVWRTVTFANLDAQLGPRWGATLRASFTTDLNSPVVVDGFPLDETIVQVELPVRYRWSSQLVVEMGGRYSERAPSLFADRFAWHFRELWAFVTLTGTTHRTRTRLVPATRPTGSPTPGTPPPPAPADVITSPS